MDSHVSWAGNKKCWTTLQSDLTLFNTNVLAMICLHEAPFNKNMCLTKTTHAKSPLIHPHFYLGQTMKYRLTTKENIPIMFKRAVSEVQIKRMTRNVATLYCSLTTILKRLNEGLWLKKSWLFQFVVLYQIIWGD